jgi:hypothetical protein
MGAHILITLRGPDRVWKNSYSLITMPDQRDQYSIFRREAEALERRADTLDVDHARRQVTFQDHR